MKAVASFVSGNGKQTHGSPPGSAQMNTAEVCESGRENPERCSREAPEAKSETLDFDKRSV